MAKRPKKKRQGGSEDAREYHLRLFVAGNEPNSAAAKASLDRICSEHPERRCRVEVIDVLQDFRPAVEERVLVTPALVIRGPHQRIVIFGNLSDAEEIMATLQTGSESV